MVAISPPECDCDLFPGVGVWFDGGRFGFSSVGSIVPGGIDQNKDNSDG